MKSARLWGLVLGFAVFQLWLAAVLPLVEDEAYYQLWASVPSAGYYDHPPMVAWAIAAGEWLFGPTGLGVRAASVLMGMIITLLTWRIAWRVSGDEDTALRAALWGKVMLPIGFAGFVATPDPASVMFWTAATWALVEVIHGGRLAWWLAVGLFAGLGVLSKFTNLFFGLALVIWLLASRDGRRWLPRWQVWAGAMLGLLVLVPFAMWNASHGWAGLERQFGRVGSAASFSLMRLAVFALSLALLVTPLVSVQAVRGFFSQQVPRLMIWLIAPVMAYLSWHALRHEAGAQWLVPIFPTLAVIAALATERPSWVARWAAPVVGALGLAVLVAGFWPGKVLIPGHNPFTQVRGWDPVIAEIKAQARKQGVAWIATNAYGLTGQLNHYLGQEIPVWSVIQPKRYLFRGPLPPALCDQPALFISRQRFAGGVPYFARTRPLPDILRKEGDTVLMRYYVARVQGLTNTPYTSCRSREK